jgi:thiol-disulfide isomerase/thioredoxin
MNCIRSGESVWRSILHSLTVICLGVSLACCVGCGGGKQADSTSKDAGQEPVAQDRQASEDKPASEAPTTARGILEAMVAAYKKASTYQDVGTVRLFAKSKEGGPVIEDKPEFSVAFVRPNKLRMHVYQAMLVCDGKKLHASIGDLPEHVLELDAPAKLTIGTVYSDPILTNVMVGGMAGGSPQVGLLLADDPLKEILAGAEEPVLLEPAKIGAFPCHRIEIKRTEGKGVLWIDRKTFAMRRIEYPTDDLAKVIAPSGKLDEISLVAEFSGAQFDAEINPTAFAFETPADAKLVKAFDFSQMPHPAKLLNKPVPEFRFADLKGNAVTAKSLIGKVTVLEFWGTQCEPCRVTLPKLERVLQKYKDNPKVAFQAVSVDPPSVANKELEDVFSGWGIRLPIVRDSEGISRKAFVVRGIPTTFIVGPDGRVQDLEIGGGNPNLETDLPAKIDKLLAGQDVYQAPLGAYQQWLDQMRENTKRAMESKPSDGEVVQQKEVPRAAIAQRTEPKVVKLSPLWKFTEAGAPGNILVVPRADGSPRVLVVDSFKKVVELGPDGKRVATHDLHMQSQEIVSLLTTAVGSDGKRHFCGVAVRQQRLHLYDENFKLLGSFPQDALENPHAGIYDALLADLNGDGALELYVGYFGDVGVQGVGLDGRRKWAFRQISNVMRLTVAGPDPKRPLLWCTHDRGSLVGLDDQGKPQGEVIVQNRPLYSAYAADLTGGGQPSWCGLSMPELGRTIVVGFNLKGEELWAYELPKGVHEQLIEPVTTGRLTGSAPGQWVLAAADGSIHVLGADGKLVDRFNYGSTLCGLAASTLSGKRVLFVSTPHSVEAWKVE